MGTDIGAPLRSMSESAENLWATVERIEKQGGAFSALVFLVIYAGFYFGIAALAAWAVSTTLGSAYWMTLLSLFLLKLLLS